MPKSSMQHITITHLQFTHLSNLSVGRVFFFFTWPWSSQNFPSFQKIKFRIRDFALLSLLPTIYLKAMSSAGLSLRHSIAPVIFCLVVVGLHEAMGGFLTVSYPRNQQPKFKINPGVRVK